MGIQNENERVRVLLASAIEFFRNGDFESAIEELKTADILDSQNPEVLYNLGIVHAKQGLHKTAVQFFDKLLALPFTFVDSQKVKKLISYSLILSNRFEEALGYLHDVLRFSPEDDVAFSLQGYCYEKMNRIDEAIASYKKVITYNKTDLNAFNSLAYLLAVKGIDLDRALLLAKKALQKYPDSAAYNDTIGYVYMKRNQGDFARNYLKKALEKDPTSPEIRSHLHELLKI
jgi:Flp pilus assembly protein TadD